MRKHLSLAASLLLSTTAYAGGYLTNTNQSVSFLRNPARGAVIAIDGAYSNPAGVGFMPNGWHLGFNLQSAYQTRTARSIFGPEGMSPFAAGIVNGRKNSADGFRSFEGKAKAPVIPSLDLARVGDKWFATFHFGITGGGGKCTFDEGLGLFEGQVAMLPVMINAIQPGAVANYSMDTYMHGRQYYMGGQFGVGYKLTDNLAISVGGRAVYADCNYYGYVRNIGVGVNTPQGVVQMPAKDFFEQNDMPHFTTLTNDRELNCDQTDWGFTPILGVDYRLGRLNLAAKYEFKTRLRLKNRSGANTSGLSEYDDGRLVPADIPAILTLGAQYEIIDGLRTSLGFHYYFDKQATQYENREKHLDGGGWEVLAGVEYDINKRWTVSAGWQSTNYGLGEDSRFISDLSFVTNSNSVGLGARFKLKEKIHLNMAYFKTFYSHYNKKMQDYNDLKATFSGMLAPMGSQLAAAAEQCGAILQNPNASAADKAIAQKQLGIITGEIGAMGKVAEGLQNFSTAGSTNYHRTNDVFGLSIEIDF